MLRSFLFMRHGETEFNRRNVRCGGDVDIPLTEIGEAQAQAAGRRLVVDHPEIDAILAGPLSRTRRTARIIADHLLMAPTIDILPDLIERRLGDWNGRSVAETQADLAAGITPPGGESEAEFQARIRRLLQTVSALPYHLPLLVGSKGVGRVLSLLLEPPGRQPLRNTELVLFHLPVVAVGEGT